MKTNGFSQSNASLVAKIYASPRYRGKWVIVIQGRALLHRSGVAGVRQLKSLLKRYPHETPTILYVPKAEALILCL